MRDLPPPGPGSPALVELPEADGGTEGTSPRLDPTPPPQSLIGRVADYLTLIAVFFSPSYGLGIGGRFGIPFSDIFFGFAVVARGFHLLTTGVPIDRLRRHSFLLGTLTFFAGISVVSSLIIGANPLVWPFLRVVIATLGTVILVATFGRTEADGRRQLMYALGFGFLFLALSIAVNPAVQGRRIGFSLHPNALGHSCMMGTFLSVWLWEHAKRPLHRWVWGGAVLANLAAITTSGSRGALLGIGVASFMYLALRGNRRLTLAAIAAAWLAVLILVTGIVTLPESNPLSRLLSSGDKTSSATYSDLQRKELLKEDLAKIDTNPTWGTGYNQDLVAVHIAYLQGWVAAGALAGLTTMLIGLTMLLLPLVMKRSDVALACGAVAVAVAWIFTNIFTARDQWVYLAITFATAQSISVLGRTRDPHHYTNR